MKYKRPETFTHADIERGVRRTCSDTQTWWQDWVDAFTGYWVYPIKAQTHAGFQVLRKEGLSYSQINEIRRMLHRVMGGLLRQIKGIEVESQKLGEQDRETNDVIKRDGGNFHGWSIPITLNQITDGKFSDRIQSQMIANLKKKFPE